MQKKMDHESDGGGSGSAQRTLTDVFLKEKGLFYILVSFTSVPHASRLMITCKELYTAEKVVLQKLPKVCDMSSSYYGRDGNEFQVVPPDGRSAKSLALVGVAQHVGSEGIEVAEEHDKRRNVDHV